MRRFPTLAAIALIAVPADAQAAHAAGPPCLTPAEFTALSSYALPSIITGTAQRCTGELSANSFLRRNGAQLAARYAERKPAAWPGAKAAILKLSAAGQDDASKMIRDLPDATQQQLADSFLQGMVSQHLPPDRCGIIDSFVRLLAPLPPENTAELIALAAGLGSKTQKAKLGSIAICPA